jgi:hypothetical protein
MSNQNQLSDLLNILSYLNNTLQNNHFRSLNQNCRVYCNKYNSNKEVMNALEELQDIVDQFVNDINKTKSELMKGIKL